MHEMSIVQNIYRIVREKMEAKFGRVYPVTRLKVVIGKLTSVVPSALEFAFEVLSPNTEFEKTEVEIEYVPLKIRCKDCGKEMVIEEPFLFCRKCDSFNVEIVTGRELYVDSFEIDDAMVFQR